MDYKEFIKKYEEAKDKERFLQKHIKTKYLPYQQKIAEAKKIVELTMYVDINDKKVFKQNTPLLHLMFIMRVIFNYTDIEWEDGSNIVEPYNALCESNLLELIISAIPNKEYGAFDTVLQMTLNDELENYRSLAGFFDSKVDALSMTLNALAEATEKIEIKNN